MKNNKSNLDWWKINAYWSTIGLVLFLVLNYQSFATNPVPTALIGIFGLLFIIGFWQKSKIIFWIALISTVLSLIKFFQSIITGTLAINFQILNSVVSYVLFGILFWKVQIAKK